MSKLGTTVAFLAGAAIGGVAVWYALKDRYVKLAEEEINSVREAYAERERKKIKELGEKALEKFRAGSEEVETSAIITKVTEKENIADYARRIKKGGAMDYSRTVVPPKTEIPGQLGFAGETPYVIAPEEFDELDGYTPVSLTYFSNGVLSDEYGVVVDDVEEIIGDALEHFGEYEDDSVYVRNDAKRCDYEILRDERTYEEFRKTLPPNI